MLNLEQTEAMLEEALSEQQGSGFALGVLRGRALEFSYLGYHYREEGSLSGIDLPGDSPEPVGPQSIFDLASLTKILVMTPLLIQAKRDGKLGWEDRIEQFVPEMQGSEISIARLMEHRSGLLAHEKYYERAKDSQSGISREDLVQWIAESERTPLAEAKTVYSDLGAILLGTALERIYGKPINQLFVEQIATPLELKQSGYRVLSHATQSAKAYSLEAKRKDFVATANCSVHNRLLLGEVDDNNCWAMGGYSAHAGLFSSLQETMTLFRNAVDLAKGEQDYFFVNPNSKPPFTHGFMIYPGLRPTDSNAWKDSIGHTGFVGTSAWFHPATETYIVLLGNARVHPTRNDDRFIDTRLNVHSVLFQELSSQ